MAFDTKTKGTHRLQDYITRRSKWLPQCQVEFQVSNMGSTFFQYFKGALKIVLIGDSKVGKTSLLSRSHELYATFSDGCSFLKKPFVHSEVYSPTVFETYVTNVDTESLGNYQANIWDTGGCGVFDSVRPLAYIDSDVFMICFDITNRESFDNLTEVWLPEIQFFQPNTPVLLVGMKCDLRSISSNRWVTVSEPSFQSSSCIFSSQSVIVSASPSQLCKTYCEDIFSCVYFLWMRFLLKKKLSEH